MLVYVGAAASLASYMGRSFCATDVSERSETFRGSLNDDDEKLPAGRSLPPSRFPSLHAAAVGGSRRGAGHPVEDFSVQQSRPLPDTLLDRVTLKKF
jgi:hypothetical protein